MNKLQKDVEELNLIGSFRMKKRGGNKNGQYKGQYNRMFPTKISTTNFLSLYTLFLLEKSTKPLYGGEMLNTARAITKSSIWNPSHGTYYPLLSQMEKAGLIKNVKNARSKVFYSITKLGKQELKLKLEEFQPLMIGSIAFFGNMLDELYSK